ncbi:MAG: hypothetical protein HZB25_02295 [Candidatus Eisenbacteria bacterium]|nr:hypothetical protein [Candidatus Eisenbacteria bacterium]
MKTRNLLAVCTTLCALVLWLGEYGLALAQPPYVLSWGGHGGAPGQFSGLHYIAVDGTGHVYTGEWYNLRIQEFESRGTAVRVWAPGGGDISINSSIGRLYSNYGDAILVYDLQGHPVGGWGSTGSGPGQFKNPQGVAVGPNGNVYVLDSGNARIQYFTSDGGYLGRSPEAIPPFVACSPGVVTGLSTSIAVDDSGNVFVAQYSPAFSHCDRIDKFTPDCTFIKEWYVNDVRGMATDHSGHLYLARSGSGYSAVDRYTTQGTYEWSVGSLGSGPGQFDAYDVAVDGFGNIFVADFGGDHVVVYGTLATPTPETTWGALRRRYR